MQMPPARNPSVEPFFDPATATYTYVVHTGPGSKAAIIDPVLDYDPKAGRTTTGSADAVLAFVEKQGLSVEWILETHVHADHLSSAPYLKETLGARVGIGAHIVDVQGLAKTLFDMEPEFPTDGRQFDARFADGDRFTVGDLSVEVMHVPGHTPACVAYRIGDALFVGDTLFLPDVGTARCDFPGGDAATLFRSIRRLLALPEETRIFVCHDYPPEGREPRCETTVGAERKENIHVRDGISEADFVAMRSARDRTLAMPVLFMPSVQINARAGALPPPAANGIRYVKIPLNRL